MSNNYGQLPSSKEFNTSFNRNQYIPSKSFTCEIMEEAISLTPSGHLKEGLTTCGLNLGLPLPTTAGNLQMQRGRKDSWKLGSGTDLTEDALRGANRSPNGHLPPRPAVNPAHNPSYLTKAPDALLPGTPFAMRGNSANKRTPQRGVDEINFGGAMEQAYRREEYELPDTNFPRPMDVAGEVQMERDRLKIETDVFKANGIPNTSKSAAGGSAYSFGMGMAPGAMGVSQIGEGQAGMLDGMKEYEARIQNMLHDMRTVEKVSEGRGQVEQETRLSTKFINGEATSLKETEILREFQFGFDQNITKMIGELKKHYEMKICKLTDELAKMTNDNMALRTRCNELFQLARQTRSDLTIKGVTLMLEMERLSRLLVERTSELESSRKMQGDQMKIMGEKITQNNQEIDQLMKSAGQSENLRVKLESEITALEAELLQMRSLNKENEAQIDVLGQQNANLAQTLREKMAEKEGLQGKIAEIERSSFEELEALRQQLEGLKKANLNARELSLKYGVEKANYERERSQYFQMLEDNKMELQKMCELFQGVKSENDKLKIDLESVRQQVFGLTNQKNLLENERMRQNDVLVQMRQELNVALAARDNYKADLEKNREELSRKNQELIKRIQDYDISKKVGVAPTSPYHYQSSQNTSYRDSVRPRGFGSEASGDTIKPIPVTSSVGLGIFNNDEDEYKKRPPPKRDATPGRTEYAYCTPISANNRNGHPPDEL